MRYCTAPTFNLASTKRLLAERDIPYHVVGDVHFYESRDVKVILDYLRTTQDTTRPDRMGTSSQPPQAIYTVYRS